MPVQDKKTTNWRMFLLIFGPAFGWMTLIFFLSNQPYLPGPEQVNMRFLFMKAAHMTVYAGLYFWWWRAVLLWQNRPHLPTKFSFWSGYKIKEGAFPSLKNFLLPALICLAFAISDEIHQSFIPGRTPLLRDVGFDLVGASIMIILIKKFSLFYPPKS